MENQGSSLLNLIIVEEGSELELKLDGWQE